MEAPPTVIALHPAAVETYLGIVERLSTVLGSQGVDADHGTLMEDFRALVHSVTVHPVDGSRSFEIEIKGRIAALTGSVAFPHAVGVKVVAEEGLEPPTRGL